MSEEWYKQPWFILWESLGKRKYHEIPELNHFYWNVQKDEPNNNFKIKED